MRIYTYKVKGFLLKADKVSLITTIEEIPYCEQTYYLMATSIEEAIKIVKDHEKRFFNEVRIDSIERIDGTVLCMEREKQDA